jgi:hypothetical protein
MEKVNISELEIHLREIRETGMITKTTPAEKLREFARSESRIMRIAVALHPNTDKETLMNLYNIIPEDPFIKSIIEYSLLLDKATGTIQ